MSSQEIFQSEVINVRTFKYNGTEHHSWKAELVKRESQLLVLHGRFEEEINHPSLGVISAGTLSIEFYWLDRWYNIFCFREPNGTLRNFYCNVTVPPVFSNNTLSYIDLDIDIYVAPDLSYRVLDEDEFAEHALKFNYPAEILAQAEQAVKELISLIELRPFPFDYLR